MKARNKAAVLLSGGKDSVFAFHEASKLYNVSTAVVMIPKNPASWMFHAINAKFAIFVAKALGIKNIIARETSGEKDKELIDLEEAIKEAKEKFKVKAIIAGAIASNYQKLRVEALTKKYNLGLYAPAWQKDQYSYMNEILAKGIKFIIVGIFCEGIDSRYLGKVIDKDDLEQLYNASKRYGFNISFEGGEAETLAIDGPLFKHRLEVKGTKIKQGEFEWIYDIADIKLIKK